MVLFDNVYVGQRVEVLWNNGIYKGTVQYKGAIATRRGEWIGVVLELPGKYEMLYVFMWILMYLCVDFVSEI